MYLRDKQKPDIKATKNGKKKTAETVQACSYSQEEFFFSMGKTTFGSLYGWRHFGRVTEELRFSSNGYGGQAKSESPRVSETSFFRKINISNLGVSVCRFFGGSYTFLMEKTIFLPKKGKKSCTWHITMVVKYSFGV